MSKLIMEMLTGEEVQNAIVKAALAKQGVKASEVDSYIKGKDVTVSYRSVRFPDGTSSLFAAVAVVQDDVRPASDTPIPVEKKDG